LIFVRISDFDYEFDNAVPSSGFAPSTPGYNQDTPSPQGPYTPQTPGGTYSPYANHATPSPMGYQGQSGAVASIKMPTGVLIKAFFYKRLLVAAAIRY